MSGARRTWTAMNNAPLGYLVSPWRPTRPRPESFHHGHGLLGDLAVHDPVRAELGLVLVPGRHQHVVRPRLAGVGDVGPRRVGLGGGVRVVDDDRFLVVVG